MTSLSISNSIDLASTVRRDGVSILHASATDQHDIDEPGESSRDTQSSDTGGATVDESAKDDAGRSTSSSLIAVGDDKDANYVVGDYGDQYSTTSTLPSLSTTTASSQQHRHGQLPPQEQLLRPALGKRRSSAGIAFKPHPRVTMNSLDKDFSINKLNFKSLGLIGRNEELDLIRGCFHKMQEQLINLKDCDKPTATSVSKKKSMKQYCMFLDYQEQGKLH